MLGQIDKDAKASADTQLIDEEQLLIDLQITMVASIRGAKFLKDRFLVYLLEMVLKHIRLRLGQKAEG